VAVLAVLCLALTSRTLRSIYHLAPAIARVITNDRNARVKVPALLRFDR
jgi:hypothetical protein